MNCFYLIITFVDINIALMRILPDNSAGLIIDIQERLLPHIYEGDALILNTVKLIKGLTLLNLPLLTTQQYSKGLGETVKPIADSIPAFSYIEKISFSCCGEPAFIGALKNTGRRCVIVCGIEAHVCVLQTCIDLLAQGYLPVIVEDCVSSRRINDKDIAIERMKKEGAIITTYESILFELTQKAGSETFKSISGIVK
jgi:nicotinamidase-related amidase